MFPASAGMNRIIGKVSDFTKYVPRERGDEPGGSFFGLGRRIMFPASAGMNRLPLGACSPMPNVPRERGDEPLLSEDDRRMNKCSPRARG